MQRTNVGSKMSVRESLKECDLGPLPRCVGDVNVHFPDRPVGGAQNPTKTNQRLISVGRPCFEHEKRRYLHPPDAADAQ